MSKIKFAVVGFGGMGGHHARHLIRENNHVEVHGIYDIKEERREAGQEEDFKVYQTLEEVLSDKEVEAVLIATPNDSHKEIAIESLKAGKHVVCEKPVMMSVSDFDDVVKVSEETGKVFMTHQNRRWDSDFLIIRDLYNKETIGELFQIESRVHGANGIPGDWRHLKAHGGGMLLDWGVHLLDQLLFMIKSPIKTVYSDMSFVLGDDCDDGFMSYIIFENGVRAHIEVETSNFIKLPRWYVKGYKGTGVIHDWDLSGELVLQRETDVKHEPTPIQAGQGLTKTMAPPSEEMTERRSLPVVEAEYESYYDNFFNVVRQDAEPVVKNSEVREVLVLIERIFESAETGKTITY
ncbi:Gfo/Idh/MocA family oxidoreductase [Vagococcus sp. PNs007]|uniref:Gfo/Idh/MocA family oxidoreductase n=1 Tax=Vagococcus proximus TaxID=2991417 RepID=A0ABT5X3E3_9ENTE|nr:Gfo/Idh/MocA family oxidoreductase [Vagococcus proximus]MDF0480519.1 Gfo/Idh/MocA family oxidoreductase [Vagococcus proximus]